MPAGSFWMGSPDDQPDRDPDEHRHRVEITRPFYLGRFEVTQGQWASVMDQQPSHFAGDDALPVDSVRWDAAVEFCTRLTAHTGRAVRLPTEAEWEYACRAGTDTRFSTGDRLSPTEANFDFTRNRAAEGQSPEATVPVGSYPPNAWGLYDMHGNVREWCFDWYRRDWYLESPATDPRGPQRGDFHVLRGGGWDDYEGTCRAAQRIGYKPGDREEAIGLRIVVEVDVQHDAR